MVHTSSSNLRYHRPDVWFMRHHYEAVLVASSIAGSARIESLFLQFLLVSRNYKNIINLLAASCTFCQDDAFRNHLDNICSRQLVIYWGCSGKPHMTAAYALFCTEWLFCTELVVLYHFVFHTSCIAIQSFPSVYILCPRLFIGVGKSLWNSSSFTSITRCGKWMDPNISRAVPDDAGGRFIFQGQSIFHGLIFHFLDNSEAWLQLALEVKR